MANFSFATARCGWLLPTLFVLQPVSALAQDAMFDDGFESMSCAEVTEAAGLFIQPSPAGWQALFNGFNWPAPFGNFRTLGVDNGQMVTMPIVAPNLGGQGGTVELAESTGLPTGPVVVSISPCRGDFRLADLANNERLCIGYGSSAPTLVWFIGGAPNPNYCALVPGQTYWLNVAYLNVPYTTVPAPSTCGAPQRCFTLIGTRTLSATELEAIAARPPPQP